MKSRWGSRIQRSARYGNGLCWFGIFGRLKLLGFISRDKRIQCWTHFPFQVLKKVTKIVDMRRLEILVSTWWAGALNFLHSSTSLWSISGGFQILASFSLCITSFRSKSMSMVPIKNTIKSAKNSYNFHLFLGNRKNTKMELKYARCRLLFPPYLCNLLHWLLFQTKHGIWLFYLLNKIWMTSQLLRMTGNDGFVLQKWFEVAFFVSHSIYMKMDLLYVLIIDILMKHGELCKIFLILLKLWKENCRRIFLC